MNDDEKETKDLLAELIELMNKNDLAELEIEEEGCRIRLRKAERPADRPVIISAPVASGQATGPQASEQPPAHDFAEIKSPMVGTFYRAPSPDADALVDTADAVTEESVVCIIEAMKVMNEIKAECVGVIKEILVADGEPVEYGQPLFLVDLA
jgi:acetyl-CoA carboxylase biotin carboxyl carrier protein